MIDLTTTLLTGTSMVAGAGMLAGHAWRSRQLATRFDTFAQRLNDVETIMYTPQEPEEQRPAIAPDFVLPSLAGTPVSLDRLRALGKPVLLVFTDPAGTTGQSLLTSIGTWQQTHDSPLTVAGIGPVSSAGASSPTVPAGITDLLVDEGRRVAGSFGVALTPAAVLIRPNGAIVGNPTVGVQGIQSLLAPIANAAAEAARMRQQRVEANAPTPGAKAPLVILPDLGDVDQPLVIPGIHQTLVFWSPDCGYCNQLVPDLRALETSRPSGSPPITLVARGSSEANRAQGFRFRTLLDDGLTASEAFGAHGTPAAVVIDADGIVVSNLAGGIRAVRELLAMDGDTGATNAQAVR